MTHEEKLRNAVITALVHAKVNGYDTFLEGPSAEIAQDMLDNDGDVAIWAWQEDDDVEIMVLKIVPYIDEWKRNLA